MRPRPPRLLLFDVDGTLLVTKGATSRSVRRACEQTLGPRYQWTKITPGLLDQQLFEQQATACGIDDWPDRHDAYRERYLEALKHELTSHRADVVVLPGVRELLVTLAKRQDAGQIVLGLLSGNYREGVMLKLDVAGIDPSPFRICAFADHGAQRHELLQAAIEQYETLIGRPALRDRVIVLGDTPRDIDCAHVHGCTAFAVATGWYDETQLREAGADRVVADLSMPNPLLELIEIRS